MGPTSFPTVYPTPFPTPYPTGPTLTQWKNAVNVIETPGALERILSPQEHHQAKAESVQEISSGSTTAQGVQFWSAARGITRAQALGMSPPSYGGFCADSFVGLNHFQSNGAPDLVAGVNGYEGIDFAVYFQDGYHVRIYESGVQMVHAFSGTTANPGYTPSDVFKVQVTGTTVQYLKNDAVFYTSLKTPTFPLNTVVSIHSYQGCKLSGIAMY
jgi:hypothetical protein